MTEIIALDYARTPGLFPEAFAAWLIEHLSAWLYFERAVFAMQSQGNKVSARNIICLMRTRGFRIVNNYSPLLARLWVCVHGIHVFTKNGGR